MLHRHPMGIKLNQIQLSSWKHTYFFKSWKLVITKGYRVRATTVKTLLLQRCALRKFHVTNGQNLCEQVTSDRRSKFHSFLVEVQTNALNECWLHMCDACVITTWRLGLQAPLVTRNNEILEAVVSQQLIIFKFFL